MKQFFTTTKYKRILAILGAIIIVLATFHAGMFVGFHKAGMAYRIDERYGRAYGGHFNGGPFGIPDSDFPESHGAIGRVLSISLPTLIVEDKNNEKVVLVAADTTARKGRERIEVTMIKPNDFIVVIGSPNEKQEIVAKFVRILPPPAEFTLKTSTASTSSIK